MMVRGAQKTTQLTEFSLNTESNNEVEHTW